MTKIRSSTLNEFSSPCGHIGTRKVFDIAPHMHWQRHGTAKRVGKHRTCDMKAKYMTFESCGIVHVRHRDTSRIPTAYQAFLLLSCRVTDNVVFFLCGFHVTYLWCAEAATYVQRVFFLFILSAVFPPTPNVRKPISQCVIYISFIILFLLTAHSHLGSFD